MVIYSVEYRGELEEIEFIIDMLMIVYGSVV